MLHRQRRQATRPAPKLASPAEALLEVLALRQIAVVGMGDQRILMEYDTKAGYHRFWPGETPAFVKEDPKIRAEHWTDLGDLLDTNQAPRLLRRRMESITRQIAVEGVSVRYFHQVGQGYIELPVGNITNGWVGFWNLVHNRVVKYDDNDQVAKDEAGAARLTAELTQAGLTHAQALGVIEAGISVEKIGYSSGWMRDHILDHLVPQVQDPLSLVPYMLYAAWMGLELGSNTPIGGWYSGTDRSYVMLGITGVLVAFWFLRRKKK